MLIAVIYDVLLAAALLLSLATGEGAERLAATVSLAGTLATVFVAEPIAARFLGPSSRLIAIDGAVAVAYCGIALASNKFWPIWAAACQLLAAAAAVEIGFTAHGWSTAAALNEQVWGWPPLIIIITATLTRYRAGKLPRER